MVLPQSDVQEIRDACNSQQHLRWSANGAVIVHGVAANMATLAEFFPRSLRYCSVVFSCAIGPKTGVAGSAENYSSEVQPLDHSSEKAGVIKDLFEIPSVFRLPSDSPYAACSVWF